VRRLAAHLRVSPTTVAAAYRDLQVRGLAAAAGRRGTRVLGRPTGHQASPDVRAGARDLSHGNPDPALLPDLEPALAQLRPRQRLYGEPPYSRPLLDLAAADFAADGVPSDYVLVVGGALDGIERTLVAHLRRGDRVAVEDPGYPAIFELLLALGLAPEPVPVDDRGFLPDALESALTGGVAAVLSTPRAQNPTGAAMNEERARQLRPLLADRSDVLLVEDDHAGRVAGAPMVTLSNEFPGRWAVVRSVSKSLGPDLRLAVMAGDRATVSRVEGRQQLGVGWVSHLLQDLVVGLLEAPSVQRLLDRATATYGERREALIAALADRGQPALGRSGFNVWVPVADEQVAVRRLLESGWAVSPGQRFRHRSPPAVRLSIGGLRAEEAVRVADALAVSSERAARTRLA
jgi:DNA-binding transcriptional MocR family regulator